MSNFNKLNSCILDIEELIINNKINVIPLYKNSKVPCDEDYYNNTYTLNDLKNHDGNYGVIVGANHKEYSLAVVDIDGYKLNNDASDEEKAKVKHETAAFIFECLKDIPNTMQVRTQSGNYHIYIWNKTVADKIHETSKNLHFPADYEITELAGKSLASSIEIFAKDKTRQCVLPGSTILNKDTNHINSYTVISDINRLSDISIIDDVNETVKDTLIKHGFTYSGTKKSSGFIDKEPNLGLKKLTTDEIKKVAEITSPIFKIIDGEKHNGAMYLGGYFSRNIEKRSAEAICDLIINDIGDIFISCQDFKKTVLKNYNSNKLKKGGLPMLKDLIKSRDKNFNVSKFIFEISLICNRKFNHDILSNTIHNNQKKYLCIDYDNNKISTYTWNYNSKKDETYRTNMHDILNLAPINVFESYNILDTNASPQLGFTFYRNGMPTKQTIKGNDIESLEKQLARRPGIVLKPKEYKGVLNEIINEYIKLEQINITEEIPIEGIFINPMNGKLCRRDDKGNTEINKPDKEEIKEALTIWSKLKNVYPGNTGKLAHILRYGLICPFSYVLKTEYSWIPMLFLYGPSQTSKTTLAEIALCPYTTISEEVSIGGGAFDTPYRIGKALSRQGTGVIVNEPSPTIEKGEPREIIKRAAESKYSREKDEKGEHVKIPAYANVIFTANSFMPTHDAFVRRSQYLEFTKKDRLSDADIAMFNKTFNHKNWNNTDFLKLRAIGDYIVWYISKNLEVLSLDYSEIINSMLNSLLDYAGEDESNWNWMFQDAELMDIGSSDVEVINQFRRMILRDNNRINKHVYVERIEDEEYDEYYDRRFKKAFIDAINSRTIDYLFFQEVDGEHYIIVNTSVKDALNEFCDLQITCKGLAGYMDCKYKTISYKNKSIKGFKIKYDDFKDFLDMGREA